MKPLCDIALRYKLGNIVIRHVLPFLGPKPVGRMGRHTRRRRRMLARRREWLRTHPKIVPVAAAYDVHEKQLGYVTGVMHEGASAGLMHGAPPAGEGERWQWLENGRAQVEELLRERPELEVSDGRV